jgi:hypothetical protein
MTVFDNDPTPSGKKVAPDAYRPVTANAHGQSLSGRSITLIAFVFHEYILYMLTYEPHPSPNSKAGELFL